MRGLLVATQQQILAEVAGEATYRAALARVPAHVREEFLGVSALSWCSQSSIRTVTRAVAEAMGQSPIDLANRVGELGATRNSRGVWSVFLRLTSDEALARRAPFIFEKAFDRGLWTATVLAPGRVRMLLRGWPSADDMDLSALAGSIVGVMVVAGRRRPRVSVRREPDQIVFDVVA